MKSSLFTNWVTYFYVAVMFFFNLNPAVFAGDDVPKFRAKYQAEKIPLINKVGRKIFGPRDEWKAPVIDDCGKAPVDLSRRSVCRPGVCHPKIIWTDVPPPPPPLFWTNVPPPPPAITTSVPPSPSNPYIETRVPDRVQVAFIETRVPDREQVWIDAGSVSEPNVVVRYIQLPCPPVIDWCPPDPCPPEIYVEERKHQVKRRHHVEHREMFVQEPPCFQERFVQEPPCFDQFNGRHGGFVGNHQGFNPGWQNGGHPGWQNGGQHYGHGSGDPLGYDTGHRIVNNAYNTGYDANARNFEIGRNIGLWNYDAAMNHWRG